MKGPSIRDLVSAHVNDCVYSQFTSMSRSNFAKLSNLEIHAILPFFMEQSEDGSLLVKRDKNSFSHDAKSFMSHPLVTPNLPSPIRGLAPLAENIALAAKEILQESVIAVYCNDYKMLFISQTESVVVETKYRPIDLYRSVFDLVYDNFTRRSPSTEKETTLHLSACPFNQNKEAANMKISRGLNIIPEQDAKIIPKNLPDTNEVPFHKVMQQIDFSELEQTLKSKIIGHDQNIDRIIKMLKIRKLNLDEKSPLSFLFAGVSGTGKTDLCLALAKALNFDCHRLDMSEYMEPHNVSRIIGAPNGYISHGEPGVLSTCSNTFNVIIVDEMEKADPSVMNIFLQALDYGVITSGDGRQIDFAKSIFIFTTNIGAKDATRTRISLLEQSTQVESDIKNSLDLTLPPEFLNRFSGVMTFGSLSESDMRKVLDVKLMSYREVTLKNHGLLFEVDMAMKDAVFAKSMTLKLGVRPMKRNIQEMILEKMVDYLDTPSASTVVRTEHGNITIERPDVKPKQMGAAA